MSTTAQDTTGIEPGPRPKVGYVEGWLDNIPDELKARRQFVGWKYKVRKGESHWTKPPFNPHRPESEARSNDPRTWGSIDQAVDAFHDRRNKWDGVGYVFAEDDEFSGADFDNCIGPDRQIMDWAKPFIGRLHSYGEISPSGNGIKIFVRGKVPGGKGRKKTKMGPDGRGAIEFYSRTRYFTLTGRLPTPKWPRAIADCGESLAEIFAELFPPIPESERRPPRDAEPLDLTDHEILARAFQSRNGHIIEGLYSGDIQGYGSHSEADFGLCSRLMFWFQGDTARIDRVVRSSGLYRDKWDQLRGVQTYGEMTLSNALTKWDGESYKPRGRRKASSNGKAERNGHAEPAGPPRSYTAEEADLVNANLPPGAEPVKAGDPIVRDTDNRPKIEITTERHVVAAQAVEALARDEELYSRGGTLAKVISEPDPIASLAGGVEIRNAQGSPRVLTLMESAVGCHLTRNAIFWQWKMTKDGPVEIICHPPAWLVRAIAEQGHWPGIRPLLAIADCPFIRPDGQIVQEPGYDPMTATLYRPSIEFLPAPASPTRDDAKAAAGRIFLVVKQFHFASDDDRAVWLAGLLTAAARPAIRGPVPGFAQVGNKAGCGKGLLIDLIGIIVWGNNVPTSCYPTDPIEAHKVKVAIALAGKPVVHLDNLEEGRFYGNPALDSALTATEVDDRILGTSRMTGRLPLRPVWFLSGNNVSPAKDAYRRWLPSNITTDLERPEERNDLEIPNLRAHVRERRAELVRDVLTVLKAHFDAKRPKGEWAPLGSFEEWDTVVRGAVWYATEKDCCVTRRNAAAEAPERLDKLALLEGWQELKEGGDQGKGITVEDALKAIEDDILEGKGTPTKYAALHAALMRLSRDGKMPSRRTVGTFIRGMKGANFENLKFEKASEYQRAALWKVSKAPSKSPDSQKVGECVSRVSVNQIPADTEKDFAADWGGWNGNECVGG